MPSSLDFLEIAAIKFHATEAELNESPLDTTRRLIPMATEYSTFDSRVWRPQAHFHAAIQSRRQLRDFNETGGIAVFIDASKSSDFDLEIIGSQSSTISFWQTNSRTGYVTQPKFPAGLLTIRFITSGQIIYVNDTGEIVAPASIATLTGFEDLREVRASEAFCALSATLSTKALIAANEALTHEKPCGLPPLEPLAQMSRPGMQSLYCTIRSIQQRVQDFDRQADLLLPLLQELMSYQLLSAWPKRIPVRSECSQEPNSRQLRLAIDFIEANLSSSLTLADVAASAGVGVRSLQGKFKRELGRTPLQFIIERRLTRAREDLSSTSKQRRSVGEIARFWGFTHMGDFGQRYRRLFGCAPSQTRRDAGRSGV